MSVDVLVVPGPLGSEMPLYPPGSGAVLTFEGVVRPTESGRPLHALRYVAYEPMTTRELERLARDILVKFSLDEIRVRHSVGEVEVGHTSLWMHLACRHRREGIDAMDEFIERLKREVPIWKVPVWQDSGDEQELVTAGGLATAAGV